MAYLLTHCDLAVLAAGGNPHLDILVGTPPATSGHPARGIFAGRHGAKTLETGGS